MKNFILITILISVSSCATMQKSSLVAHLNKSNCNQENTYNYSIDDIPKPIHELRIDTTLTSHFNTKDINLANAIGVLDLLSSYINKINEVKETHSLQSQIEVIKIRQEINNKIDLASLEISSVSAELDCEEERINQIVSYMKENEMKKETRLTVGSIILGSLTAIATGVLVSSNNESKTSDYIGIGTGLADAVIGVLILTNKQKIKFNHPRNVLKEIWFATETSSVYPPSIWYYLNYKNPNNKDEISLREQLVDNWKTFGQVASLKSKSGNNTVEIYFDAGGKYTSDQLENRANMYDQLESIIKLMKQDLRNLTLSVNKMTLN
ncbi:MAG: hypothetical protein J5I50_08380 [Chitinophagaceae bacterium]|nr:hypothetical protein [Chitinophagaceae bacterium]